MIRFSLSRFRCFFDAKPVPIAPITLLVGENSTGKTSYLAALRAVFDSFNYGSSPSFNKDPFHLGAFNQIVNVRRGRKQGRASEFSFTIAADIDKKIQLDRRSRSGMITLEPGEVSVRFTFHKSGSQPVLFTAEVSYLGYKITVIYGAESTVMVSKGREIHKLDAALVREYFGEGFAHSSFRYTLIFLVELLQAKYSKRHKPGPDFAVETAEMINAAIGIGLKSVLDKSVRAIAPIRSKPRRTYDPKEDERDSEGEYVPYRLSRLKHESREKFKEIKAALERYGAASGLFDSFEIKQLGKTDSDPFQMVFKINGTSSNLVDVGYGFSQAVPLVTDIVLQEGATIFLIQQPEVHLHPKAQAEFATFILTVVKATDSYLIIETHSDYILDRLRSHVRIDRDVHRSELSIIYFERKGQAVYPHAIEIDDKGEISSAPASYRRFFLREEMRLLGLRDVSNS